MKLELQVHGSLHEMVMVVVVAGKVGRDAHMNRAEAQLKRSGTRFVERIGGLRKTC